MEYQNRSHQPSKTRLLHCGIQQINIAQPNISQVLESTQTRNNWNLRESSNQTYQLLPHRLSELHSLSEAQSLKLMHSIFRALEDLAPTLGYFLINDNSISIYDTGKVKVEPPKQKEKENNNSMKTLINVSHIVNIIERKCFNSSFLRPFVKKMNENKITSYRQAADEILKIGELLFISIQEKTSFDEIKYQQMLAELKKIKIKKETSLRGVHSRKFSYFEEMKERRHRRYESIFLKSDKYNKSPVEQPHSLNVKKTKENSQVDNSGSQVNKSAPQNFSDDATPDSIPPSSCSAAAPKESKVQARKPDAAFQKKPEKSLSFCNSLEVMQTFYPQAFNPTLEQTPSFNNDNSFSKDLTGEDKHFQVSGEFQTFGLLQDDEQRNHNKSSKTWQKPQNDKQPNQESKKQVKQEILKNQRKSEKFKEYNSKEIEIEIEKRLRKMFDNKNQKINRLSETVPEVADFSRKKSQLLMKACTIGNQKMKTTTSDHKDIYNENSYQPPLSFHQVKHKKSPSLAFIDQKYEEYMRGSNKVKVTQPHTMKITHTTPSRHFKQWSSYESMASFQLGSKPGNGHDSYAGVQTGVKQMKSLSNNRNHESNGKLLLSPQPLDKITTRKVDNRVQLKSPCRY